MNAPADVYDVIIIGAGAAGLSSARSLHDSGRRVLVLEARDRIGGRIWTDNTLAEFPVELGAEFIHGEHAPTHDLVQQANLNTRHIPRKSQLRWGTTEPAVLIAQLDPTLKSQINALTTAYNNLPDNVSPDIDRSLEMYFRRQGFDDDAIQIADVLFAQTCCAPIHHISCRDLIHEMQVDRAGANDYRIIEGYGALLSWYADGLPIQLNTPVTQIDWHADPIRVYTETQIFTARKCIVTVPVGVLLAQTIYFDPPLTRRKHYAIRLFGFEPATKLIYGFNRPFWDDELVYMAHNGTTARWWTPGYGHEGAAVICAFLTADRARKVNKPPEPHVRDMGLSELSQLLGVSIKDLRKSLVWFRRVSWSKDVYTRGGYAHVPPHVKGIRQALAEPEGDKLFFAGEATAYDSNPQTVHGAIESGWRAAQETGFM